MVNDLENLSKLILLHARNDIFNGTGRVFIETLKKEGYTYDQIIKAVDKLSYVYDIKIIGNIIKIKF